MSNPFFDHPILNSPYHSPQRHWELDADGQPTQQVLHSRRRASFVSPIPKPRKRIQSPQQAELALSDGNKISTEQQQYIVSDMINQVRQSVRFPKLDGSSCKDAQVMRWKLGYPPRRSALSGWPRQRAIPRRVWRRYFL